MLRLFIFAFLPYAFCCTCTYRLKVTTFFIHIHFILDICLLFVVYSAAAAAGVDFTREC